MQLHKGVIRWILICVLTTFIASCNRSRFNGEAVQRDANMVDVVLNIGFADAPSPNLAPNAAPTKGVQNDFISLTNAPMNNASTKAGASADEQKIHNLNLFFVRPRYEGLDSVVRHVYIPSDKLTTDEVTIKDIYLGTYILYMVANVGDLTKPGDWTAREVKELKLPLKSDNSADMLTNGLPMKSLQEITIRFTGDKVEPIAAKLNFAVARVEYDFEIDESLRNKIYLSAFQVVNAASEVEFFIDTAAITHSIRDQLPFTTGNKPYTHHGVSYVYPNKCDTVDQITSDNMRTIRYAPLKATYLYFEAKLDQALNNSSVMGFYVYLGDQGDPTNFNTNAGIDYRVNIKIKSTDNDPRISTLDISTDNVWSGTPTPGNRIQIPIYFRCRNMNRQAFDCYVSNQASGRLTYNSSLKKGTENIETVSGASTIQAWNLFTVDKDEPDKTYEYQIEFQLIQANESGKNVTFEVSLIGQTGSKSTMTLPVLYPTQTP